MPPTTVRPRSDRLDVAADIVARIVDTADLLVASPNRRAEAVEALVADADLLVTQLTGWHSRPCYAEIADRLWMVGLSAGDAHDLAVTTGVSWGEKLIDGDDAVRVTKACLRALGGRS